MAISFEGLPQDKPVGKVLDNGFYKAHIIKAEMKTPKPKTDGTEKKDYLGVTYELTNTEGKPCGKFWDNFFDVDKDLPRYKLARLLNALHIVLSGEFELKDLSKIINDKWLVVDIGTDEKNDPIRNQIEVFANEIYYPVTEWASLGGTDVDIPTTTTAPAEVAAAETTTSNEEY